MQIYAKTHKGMVRPTNQDSLLVAHNLYGVADGMGGHRGGETASRIAVQVVKNLLQGKTPEENSLRICMEAANRRIFDMQRHDLALSGMGTTFTLLWESRTEIWIAHVGDSRAYLFRDGKLACQTLSEQYALSHFRGPSGLSGIMQRKWMYLKTDIASVFYYINM